MNAIRVCRTAALGIDTYACHDCGEVRELQEPFMPVMQLVGHAQMGGTHERKDAASAAPPCGDDLAAYLIGFGKV